MGGSKTGMVPIMERFTKRLRASAAASDSTDVTAVAKVWNITKSGTYSEMKERSLSARHTNLQKDADLSHRLVTRQEDHERMHKERVYKDNLRKMGKFDVDKKEETRTSMKPSSSVMEKLNSAWSTIKSTEKKLEDAVVERMKGSRDNEEVDKVEESTATSINKTPPKEISTETPPV